MTRLVGLAGVIAIGFISWAFVADVTQLRPIRPVRAAVIAPKPLYAWYITWYVHPVHLRDTVRVDSIYRPIPGDSAQGCLFATDTESVNGHRWSRRVLMNGTNPVCAVAFRMWDSLQTAKYGGPWP